MPKAQTAPQQSAAAEAFDPSRDSFTLQLINRKVSQLLYRPGFHDHEREDLAQEILTRVIRSLEGFDPAVGPRYPFIMAVVDRHLVNILRSRNAGKRDHGKLASLNVTILVKDVGQTELIQTIGDREADRRLGRGRSLTEEQLNDLRLDLQRVIAGLPKPWQELLERHKTQSISEISREMGIARTTLLGWVRQIRQRFEDAGLDEYFKE